VLRNRTHGRVVLLGAVLCGSCSPSLEPIAVAPDCPRQPFRGPERYADEPADRLVSDFEGGGTDLAVVANRDGHWIHGRDLTSQSVTIGPSMDCAARGQWAGRLAASMPTGWGNNWTAYFRDGSGPLPYDGRQYGGISFWAAFGGENGPPFGVSFGMVTMDTVRPSCSSPHCDDHYMADVPLAEEWRRYELRFDDLTQKNDPQLPMRRDQLVGFIIWTRQQCDIWIDDVRLEP